MISLSNPPGTKGGFVVDDRAIANIAQFIDKYVTSTSFCSCQSPHVSPSIHVILIMAYLDGDCCVLCHCFCCYQFAVQSDILSRDLGMILCCIHSCCFLFTLTNAAALYIHKCTELTLDLLWNLIVLGSTNSGLHTTCKKEYRDNR